VSEALDIGLISHVAAPGKLEEKLASIVVALLAKPAGALRQTQRLLRHGARDEIFERMQLEGQVFAERLGSAEAKAAITAFFQARGKKP
jgi:enoyl-CoA hydratase/carnithine racemase